MSLCLPAVGEMMAEGWVLLDVRPPGEVEKVAVKGEQHSAGRGLAGLIADAATNATIISSETCASKGLVVDCSGFKPLLLWWCAAAFSCGNVQRRPVANAVQ